MKILKMNRALPALMVAGMGWGILSGCSDTSIVNSVLDQQVQDGATPVQIALVRGSNGEVHDVWNVGNGYGWQTGTSTDDYLNTETASDGVSLAIGEFPNDESNTIWGQGMEASWSGLKVVNNLMEAPTINFDTSPLVARGYVNAAAGERLMADAFCEVAYGFDHTGGQDLPNLGPDPDLDNAAVPQDSAWKRVVTFAGLAVEAAERSIAAGEGNPVNEGVFSDILFDPEFILSQAHGFKAQGHLALASLGVNPGQNWDLAVQHAQQVDTDFEAVDVHGGAESNDYHNNSWDNDNYTLYSEAAPERPEGFRGVPGTWLWPDDPRIAFHDCFTNEIGECSATQGEGPEGPNGNGFPMWNPSKYDDDDSHIPMVKGVEMRLIEAEKALVVDQDFDLFYDLVDEVRDFYGLDPTARPMVMGDFEWPNAEDDAMSILDRERYLTLNYEGRRLFDLNRWDHPYLDGRAMIERHDDALQGGQRSACMPISENECQLNPALAGSASCAGL